MGQVRRLLDNQGASSGTVVVISVAVSVRTIA
jgi:hypothetical protein